MDLLKMKPLDSLDLLSEIVQEIDETVDIDMVRRVSKKLARYWTKGDNGSDPEVHLLEDSWYRLLRHGKINYDIYGGQLYLAEAWATWSVRSRCHLKEVVSSTLPPPLGVLGFVGDVDSVLDVGCGIGFSTAALTSMFPRSVVVGTNIIGTMQTCVAEVLGSRIGYSIKDMKEVKGPVDLVFASEYFEHFLEPTAHLKELLVFDPKYLLIANAFGTQAAGHFDYYKVDDCEVAGPRMGKIFNNCLIRMGYRKIHTNLWNDRPSLWEKVEAPDGELKKIARKQKKAGFGLIDTVQ